MAEYFYAMVVTENKDGSFSRRIEEKVFSQLPEGDVTIKVLYSSLNYKDALSAVGNRGVTKNYPHTPGIDAAGIVVDSKDKRFATGEEVVVTGYDLGMNRSGGFSQYIRVPSDWIIKMPENFSLKESMIYGTAGFTAAIAVSKLEKFGISPEKGEILVTGGTGGVGIFATAILAKLGYDVAVMTGKSDKVDFIKSIGGKRIISRDYFAETKGKPLLKEQWQGAVDSAGGDILSGILKSVKREGVVAACGLVDSPNLNMTVFPFILRGVTLIGVDSVELPRQVKEDIWGAAGRYKVDNLENMFTEVTLSNLDKYIDDMLKGSACGRILVQIEH